MTHSTYTPVVAHAPGVPVAHALVRAASALVPTLGVRPMSSLVPALGLEVRSHECERGTHECVRYEDYGC
jgi:hypothetical protein